jgi:plastocyanin
MKKLVAAFVFLSVLTLMVVACGGSSTSGSGNASVHMGDTTFLQSSVTISKGSSVTLTDDSAATHIIANGSWVNGSPQPMQENGAPVVKNLQISGSGSSQTIGPFTTTGTFHLYCTVHPGMNLNVIVQ